MSLKELKRTAWSILNLYNSLIENENQIQIKGIDPVKCTDYI
jgi:hypothetical protein